MKIWILLFGWLLVALPAVAQPGSEVLCSQWVADLDDAQVEDLWLNGFVEGMLAGYEAGTQLVRVVGHIEQGPGGRWEEPVRAAPLKAALKAECAEHPSQSIVHAALVAGLSMLKGEAVASRLRQTLERD